MDKPIHIAIAGSTGYIGTQLNQYLRGQAFRVSTIGRQNSDLYLDLNYPENFDFHKLSEFSYILFTAAVSSPDQCTADYNQAWQINVTGTNYFIKRALQAGCKVLFFSSDAVYGFADQWVDESSPTVGDTAYGYMKKTTEDAFQSSPDFKSIRLSYVFSAYDKYSRYLRKCSQTGETAEIYHPFYRSCASIDDVLYSVSWLLEHWLEFPGSSLNICGNELISRIRIADEMNRILERKIQYTIVNPGKSFYKVRPAILEMKSLYLSRILKNYQDSFASKIQKQLTNDTTKDEGYL